MKHIDSFHHIYIYIYNVEEGSRRDMIMNEGRHTFFWYLFHRGL
jgi:hypothetical protein